MHDIERNMHKQIMTAQYNKAFVLKNYYEKIIITKGDNL